MENLIRNFSATLALYLSTAFYTGSCQPPCRGNDSNCLPEEICVEDTCVPAEENSSWPNHSESWEKYKFFDYGSTAVFSGVTDAAGEFSLPGDDSSSVKVVDRDGLALSGVDVTYFRNPSFRGFQFAESGYLANFTLLPPVSSPARNHSETNTPSEDSGLEFTLISGDYLHSTLFSFDQSSHPQEVLAFDYFTRWARDEAYLYEGCLTREDLLTARERTSWLLSYFGTSSFFSVLNFVVDTFMDLEEAGFHSTFPEEAYDIYASLNFTSPNLLRGHPLLAEEISDNSYDDNCNGLIDEE